MTDPKDTQAEIRELHDAMVEVGIVPDDLKIDEHGCVLIYCPQQVKEDTWEYLGDSYGLFVLTGIAERWLWNEKSIIGSKRKPYYDHREYYTIKPLLGATGMSLPAALYHTKDYSKCPK